MDVAEREQQVRNFVEKVWNARSYEAASELFSEKYVNPFGSGPSAADIAKPSLICTLTSKNSSSPVTRSYSG